MTIYVITPRDILVRNIGYWSASRVPCSRSYLFGRIMWHNGNSKWEPICVSRYKQCHFRAGHGFVFKPDANNNRSRYANGEVCPPPFYCRICTRDLPVDQLLPCSNDYAHLCACFFFVNVVSFVRQLMKLTYSIFVNWASSDFLKVLSASS